MRRTIPFFLVALFFTASASSLYLLYLAGCAGDTKGGAIGSPVRALALEGQAFAFEVAAVALGAGLIFRLIPGSGVAKGSSSVLAVVVALVALFIMGFEVETAGLRACWP